MRKLSTLVLALCALLLLSLGSVAAAASHGHGHKSSKHHPQRKARKASAPLSGIYDSCSVSSPNGHDALPDCADRLAVLSQGRLRLATDLTLHGAVVESTHELGTG